MGITYDSTTLRTLRNKSITNRCILTPKLKESIKQLDIHRHTLRGKRSGFLCRSQPIEVLIRNRISNNERHNKVHRNNLTELKPVQQHSSCGKWIKFALINARSVRNKSVQICDYIVENNFDFIAVTETWLAKSDEQDIIRSVTPAGYSFYNNPRAKGRGGGTGLIIKSNIKIKPVAPSKFQTFELQESFATVNSVTYRLSIIYRPPPNQKNGFTFREFYNEFCEYVTKIASLPELLLILGDFNINFNHNSNQANKLRELLDINGLTQFYYHFVIFLL